MNSLRTPVAREALDFGQLVSAVQQNCHISDARYAGDYTICIFLLKMREYYRWENDIPYSGTLPKNDVGLWLQERERLWSTIESHAFQALRLDDEAVDPFESERINRVLAPHGYVYSGGYGRFSKPHFFLGDLVRQETNQGYTVYIAGCEYARDLVAPPAMLQGKIIYLRQESVRRYLWEKIEEWRWNRSNATMQRALDCYPFDADLEASLDRMVENESRSMILHELGEGLAGETLGTAWNDMLLALSRSKAEIMARAVRDLLADCLSTLPGLIAEDNHPALHFYFANLSGMRKHLFPEAAQAYHAWIDGAPLAILTELAARGRDRWWQAAHTMLRLSAERGEQAAEAIVALLDPTHTA
jgi:hypothetical protein